MDIFYNLIKCLIFSTYWLLIANITFRVLIKRRNIPYSMSWLLTIYIIPFIGISIWFFFGELYLGKRQKKIANRIWSISNKWLHELKSCTYIFQIKNSEVATSIFQLCKNRQGLHGIKSKKIKLLTNTKKIMQILIRDIYLARKNIEMVFYIWKPGGMADDVAIALIDSAKRGIHCRLMLDSAGSIEFFQSPWVEIMRKSGIQVVEALKVNLLRVFLRRVDVRQHRKIILIDNYIAYSGSMNLVDPYLFKKSSGIGQWIDLMTRIEGPIATTMGIIYSCDWEIETGLKILPQLPNKKMLENQSNKNASIQVIASGPGFLKNMIHQALLTAIYSAKRELIITTPYLVPSEDLLEAICTAAQRGVEVSIIIPLYHDSILVKWASRVFFSELLEAGVKIFQFQKGLLHSKSILVDQQLSLIGTVNLDMRSLWLNFEITLVIDDSDFGRNLFCIQNKYISDSQLIDKKAWSMRAYWKRILEKIFYFLSPLL
ncbi:cardiolipin synthase [Buchnera aphidicola]|uniref:Cardiolipin synthase A n=2 Tax=Buchnera aphidicola TaxID=9 RepID=CLSA_BUCA5|nr:cardiolipin synthase [Buchnera aphidicola]B8D7H0.1 RecName: Full=Cardiolipin synthase A; Short=CL synthase [Buchnera aphidicola str. Tuc7 (Acyrthosiphon pisum)]B8D966.1 RecName: Full=Cardiolipin synthase A; Short=CL synthase [Buchnera aphidicola str. 5A (Acyrthosiphon pisum)]ADP66667.1 cardiolipin synthetase [Buchnera aphidicola str. TLW03 (Acyrthosiphon pisum)]OQX99763.1 MAG: cardiolipin synthase A [Erwiniaceae bacterium 4572_131]ACL30085.1 cardiolipin synthetase [Buchnera aphidicola str. 